MTRFKKLQFKKNPTHYFTTFKNISTTKITKTFPSHSESELDVRGNWTTSAIDPLDMIELQENGTLCIHNNNIQIDSPLGESIAHLHSTLEVIVSKLVFRPINAQLLVSTIDNSLQMRGVAKNWELETPDFDDYSNLYKIVREAVMKETTKRSVLHIKR